MPVLICPREKLWTRTYYVGDQVPICPVFTRAKIKVPFWDFSQFAVTILTVLFQTIQFCISSQFSSIKPIDRTLSGATTLDQCWPGSDGKERVLRNPQSSSITGASPWDCLVSYPGHSLREFFFYSSAEKQSMYSTAPVGMISKINRCV